MYMKKKDILDVQGYYDRRNQKDYPFFHNVLRV